MVSAEFCLERIELLPYLRRCVDVGRQGRHLVALEVHKRPLATLHRAAILSLGNTRAVAEAKDADVDVAVVNLDEAYVARRVRSAPEVLHPHLDRHAESIQRVLDSLTLRLEVLP